MGQLSEAVNRVSTLVGQVVEKVSAENLADVCDKIDEERSDYESRISQAGGSGYNSGYADGETSGYNSGYADGYGSGYADGETSGYNSGYNSGYADGYGSGYADGETSGYNSGHDSGYADGYGSGYADGETSGYNSGGYNSGYADGYGSGYADGQASVPPPTTTSLSVTSNGTYTPSEGTYYDSVEVNVESESDTMLSAGLNQEAKRDAVGDSIADNNYSDILQITPYIPADIGYYMQMYYTTPSWRSDMDGYEDDWLAPNAPNPSYLNHCGFTACMNKSLNISLDNAIALHDSTLYESQHQAVVWDGWTKDWLKILYRFAGGSTGIVQDYVDGYGNLTQQGRLMLGMRNMKSLRPFGESIGESIEGWGDKYDYILTLDEFFTMLANKYDMPEYQASQLQTALKQTFSYALGSGSSTEPSEIPQYVIMTCRYMRGAVNIDDLDITNMSEEQRQYTGELVSNYQYSCFASLINSQLGSNASIFLAFITPNYTSFSNVGYFTQWMQNVAQGGDGQWMIPGDSGSDD